MHQQKKKTIYSEHFRMVFVFILNSIAAMLQLQLQLQSYTSCNQNFLHSRDFPEQIFSHKLMEFLVSIVCNVYNKNKQILFDNQKLKL